MAIASEPKPGFWRLVWNQAYADWKPSGGRLVWGALTAAAGFGIGGAVGAQMTPPQGVLLAGLIGAVGGVFLIALLHLLWCLLRAPAKVWREQQVSMSRLEGELLAARGGLEPKIPSYMQFGSVDYPPGAGYKIYFFHFADTPLANNFRVLCDRDIEGVIIVRAKTLADPFESVGTTLYQRRETSFCFFFHEQHRESVKLVDFALHPTSVRIVEIQELPSMQTGGDPQPSTASEQVPG